MPISRKTVVEYYPESVYNRASAYSNAVVDDCYDLHHHSKGRDHHLLKKMNNALHPEEFDPKTSFSSPSSRSSMSRRHPRHHQHTSYRSSSNTEPNHSSSETSCTDLVPFLESARNQLSRSQPFCARSNLGTGNKRFTSLLHEKPNEHYDSPLTAYIKGKWTTPVPSPTVDRSLSSNLHHPLFEDTSSRTLSLPKYSYLDSTDFSSDEEYDTESKYGGHTIVERKRPYKPGQLLKALRRKRRERDENSAPEDNGEGAYAIVYKDDLEADDENTEAYTDDEHDYKIVSRRKHRYLNRESSPEYDGDLPVAPYHSKLHKYQKYDDDIGVNSLVAMATLRARDALRQIAGVNSKAGYLSIEGDIRPHGGELSTFKLESPFQFRGPLMINQRPQLSASNDAYENLVMTLRRQRESERERLNSNFIMKKPALQIAPYSQSQSSLRPLGYMSDESLKSYTKALMPSNSPFDRTIVTPLTPKKSVHFDDEFEPRSSSSFLRELYPTEPAERRGDREAAEEEQQQYEMAVAPRRRRYPIYEYTEEIPVKIKVDDDSDYEDISPGRLSVVEKIRIKLSTQPLRSPKAAVATRRATSNSAQTVRFPAYNEVDLKSPAYYVSPLPLLRYVPGYNRRFVMTPKHKRYAILSNWGDYFDDEDLYFPPSKLRYHPTGVDRYAMHPLHYYNLRHHLPDWRHYTSRRHYGYAPRRYYSRYYPTHYMALKVI
eukprot:XP_014777538.1 PREDICTED: uncharacterized protein LOC106874347 [Octopus bimaculoides]